MKTINGYIQVFLFCLMIFGCSDKNAKVGSQSVFTKDIFAEIHVTDDNGKRVAVEVQLKQGGNTSTFIELEGGDQLVASTIGQQDGLSLSEDLFEGINQLSKQQKRMKRGNDITFNFFGASSLGPNGIWYNASFQESEARAEYTISLMRTNNDNAPGSTVTLPDAFEITAPISDSSEIFSHKTDDIIVTWSPSGMADAMALAAIITCEDGGSDTWSESLSGDTGTFTITASTFSGLTSDCTVSLNLQRCRSGLLDPNYGMGGIISGRQSRTVNFNTVE